MGIPALCGALEKVVVGVHVGAWMRPGPVARLVEQEGIHGILATRDAAREQGDRLDETHRLDTISIWEESVGRRAIRSPSAVYCLFRLTAY